MGIKNCCCSCLDLTEDFKIGDKVKIKTVANSIEGEIEEIRENTIVLDGIVICCAHIVSIEPLIYGNGNGEEP
ncbi:hypothetical protein [Anaerobranca gottschalkii]|uniref:Uncharacterized protein n=1 Tax=Anaerobranca gottschalkii DSM 13577 TaxID=1120990 RepID=A0A1H9ZMS8_9FIRM|nr:hypothetical protein [Anaerobranca gottschalkii]SES83022.1 hypothetical protein SAMN03080614_101118 [Anaerobranca gottschalkii DSM 13577]